jgi:threonine dehydrogenase-like Zn-dependent dehydrogenase
VVQFTPGDRVACTLSHRSVGTIGVNRVTRIPAGVSFAEAAFLNLGIIALQGVRKARIELGESVLVIGLGIVGQLALQFARLHGALPVIGLDYVSTRRQIASTCGADSVLDAADQIWKKHLQQQTGGTGPHVVIEATGAPEVVAQALQAARPFGRVVLLGSSRGESTVNFYRDVHKRGLTVLGAHLSTVPEQESRPGFWRWCDNAECFMKLLQGQRIRLAPLITERIVWEGIAETYRHVLAWDREMIGTVITWQ